jgi:hypothetical protein
MNFYQLNKLYKLIKLKEALILKILKINEGKKHGKN